MKLYSFEELLEEDRALGVQVALEMKGIGKVAL